MATTLPIRAIIPTLIFRSRQSDLGNGASFRGTAVPAVITGGTPVPRFVSLFIGRSFALPRSGGLTL